ncbi:TetR family transcriptional regulator [Catenulispora subtropica]|uniref:TetR/AcrR family transcriptional regulator n=1 Tax=Catenulispora subtropica TaxID=450798 RepID=A0ABN2QJM6_9ACTN
MGLREQKKQQTRTALADAALALFTERGFEHVTVAEVAAAAGVSVNTAFNYFPTKEDLFFDRQQEVEGRLAGWVRGRMRGRSPSEAVRDGLLTALAEGDPTLGLSPEAEVFWRTIDASPSLRARSREIAERSEAALAAALAEESAPGDPLPRLLAGALAGTYRAVVAEIRHRLAAGEEVAAIRVEMTVAAQQMFDALIAAES